MILRARRGLYSIHIRAWDDSGSLFSEFWPRLVVQ